MVVLDTDHLSLLQRRESAGSQILQDRLDRLDTGSRATTIVTYEEQTRGWMAYMARAKTVAQEIDAYSRLKTTSARLPTRSSSSISTSGQASNINGSVARVSASEPWI